MKTKHINKNAKTSNGKMNKKRVNRLILFVGVALLIAVGVAMRETGGRSVFPVGFNFGSENAEIDSCAAR